MKKLTLNNYERVLTDVDVPKQHQLLVEQLIIDVNNFNNRRVFPNELEIYIITHHTEYSPERVDPCPDYYGTYLLKWKNCKEYINDNLTLYELDNHLCTLCLAFNQLLEMNITFNRPGDLKDNDLEDDDYEEYEMDAEAEFNRLLNTND